MEKKMIAVGLEKQKQAALEAAAQRKREDAVKAVTDKVAEVGSVG